jgi:hypothetical protein
MLSRDDANSARPLSAEAQLLILCARTRVSEEQAERIRAIVNSELDWSALFEGAMGHGVTALLCHQLLTVCPEDVPAARQERLRAGVAEIARGNLYLAAEMFRLANRFRKEGMFAVPYKGPLLAAQAYGDFALRQFADLDFAIRQRDLPRAAALLAADGYNAVFGAITADEASRPTHSEYQFRRPAGSVVVEMQTEVTLRYFPQALDFDALESRVARVPFAGGETLSFSPEDTLILLAVHGAKHFWERLLWIADISELSQSEGGIDWTVAFSRAKQMEVSRMLNLALYLAHRMLEAPLPDDVREKVLRDPVARKLGEGIGEQFSMTAAARMPVFARFWFRVASRDRFWAGMRFALRLATSPTEPDRAAVPLPERMSGVRRWLRPVLLMKRHGIRRPKSGERR